MKATKPAKTRTPEQEVRAVMGFLNKLRRKHPHVSVTEVVKRLYAPDPNPNVVTVPPWRHYPRVLANEPARRAMRKRMTTDNRKLVAIRTRLRDTLPFLGYPLRCQECGAQDAGERTVWCPSNCAWATVDTRGRRPTDRLPRKERILEELTRALWPTGTRLAPLPKYGPRSRKGWLPEYAARLADYLGPMIGERPRCLATYTVVARLLTVASKGMMVPSESITTQMVKDRIERLDKTK